MTDHKTPTCTRLQEFVYRHKIQGQWPPRQNIITSRLKDIFQFKGFSMATDQPLGPRRNNVLPWEDYFLAIAFLSGQRSKDPVTQVGACIVNKRKRIVGTGYNGMPDGCHDDDMPWKKGDKESLEAKHLYVCHAEMNAIVNKNSADVEGCTVFVSLFPCSECAKIIIQSGIKEVVYYSDKKQDSSATKAAKIMFDKAKVTYRQYTPTRPTVEIDFSSIDKTSNQ